MNPEPGFFQRFVCRVAGAPARILDGLRADRGTALLAEVLALEERLRERREPLSIRLHEQIGTELGPERRNGLIRLRRDLYNLRPVDAGRLEGLAGEVRREVEDFLALREDLDRASLDFERIFASETQAARERFREALGNEDFQRALLLSSHALYRAQERYRKAPPLELRTRERQIERGLLKYLTRMAMKATPFATFCATLPGALAAAPSRPESPLLGFEGDPLRKCSRPRLNKVLYGLLVFHLSRDRAVRGHFYVKLNPTIRPEGENLLVFLSTVRGLETFQRIRPNPALQWIRETLGAGETRLADLIRQFAGDAEIDAPVEHVEAYVDRLIEIGFLHLTTGIPSQELDWDQKLQDLLAEIDHTSARQSASLLGQLRERMEEYDRAPGEERAALLDRMETFFESFRSEQEIPVAIPTLVFEDASAQAAAVLPRSPDFLAIERALAQFVELTSPMSLTRRDLLDMRHFFDSFYGETAGPVPLLRFYEDFYREHYKNHLEQEARARRGEPRKPDASYDFLNPFGLDSIARLVAARHRFVDLLEQAWSPPAEGRDEISLTAADLREIARDLEPLPRTSGWSLTLYGDLVAPAAPGEHARLVVQRGCYVTGFGKMFSRFLYLFPEDFEADLRRNNRELGRDTLAELCDDANFNVNLHPPLIAQEISYPIGESRGGRPGILPSDLTVARVPREAGSLELRHALTGRTVLPVDTGFMNIKARSPLYKLLASFTPGPFFLLPVAVGGDMDSTVAVRPRITFEDRIILFRKSWRVPGPVYPRKQPGETEREYFVRIARWRREQGIPEEVYVKLRPARYGTTAETASRPEVDPEAYKPQYIDFRSPLLAGLFGHLAPEHDGFVAILEERLPGRDALLQAGGEPLVTELVLQLEFPARDKAGARRAGHPPCDPYWRKRKLM